MLSKIDIMENTKYISLKLFETEIQFKLEDMVKPLLSGPWLSRVLNYLYQLL